MNLLGFQRHMASVIMAPLTRDNCLAETTKDGKRMESAALFVKPNLQLSPVDRIEIYARSYWCRVIDSIYEDFPGLRVVLGKRRFDTLVKAYLTDCPSRSFSLRDLGSRLAFWLRRHPNYAGKELSVALDMVRLEWAHIEAWDAKSETVLDPEHLLELGPTLRIGLQPYVRLLHLRHTVDDIRLRERANEQGLMEPKKGRHLRSNELLGMHGRENIWLAVHRLDACVYYKRLAADEYTMLTAMRDGQTIGEVLTSTPTPQAALETCASRVETLFAHWAEIGWLCQPANTKTARRSRL